MCCASCSQPPQHHQILENLSQTTYMTMCITRQVNKQTKQHGCLEGHMTISFPKGTTSGMNLYLIHRMTLYNHVILDNKLNLCPKDEAPLVQVQNHFFIGVVSPFTKVTNFNALVKIENDKYHKIFSFDLC